MIPPPQLLVQLDPLAALLIPPGAGKDERSRLTRFIAWNAGAPVQQVNLDTYRDHLLARGLSPASAAAHLSTIRAALRRLAQDNDHRDSLYALTPADANLSDRKAFVDEMQMRLSNAVQPHKGQVKLIQKRDDDGGKHLRLTPPQAEALLSAPGLETLMALRDTAILALMLCTGLREMEVCALTLDDVHSTYGDAPAVEVKEGKGAVQRKVIYGALDWCLAYVDKWAALAGIKPGKPLFRGFYKGGKRLRTGALTEQAVQDLLDRYPISIQGTLTTVNPHDLRRTYAKLQYDAGMEPIAIQQNLGHADLKTTLLYIGKLETQRRAGRSILKPPHLDALYRLTTLDSEEG